MDSSEDDATIVRSTIDLAATSASRSSPRASRPRRSGTRSARSGAPSPGGYYLSRPVPPDAPAGVARRAAPAPTPL